jgi:molybdenum cofactor biosynthesis enzyme MoaA
MDEIVALRQGEERVEQCGGGPTLRNNLVEVVAVFVL